MARTVGSIGSETAKRVLKEACSLFASRGYAAVSMREMASECGLQVGALYNHFPNKQAILYALMESHMQILLDALSAENLPHDPLSALEVFIRFHIGFHIDKPEEVFIAYMELRNLEPVHFQNIMKLRQRYERVLRGILRDGQASGAFQIDDVPVTAMSIISMLRGVNTWYRYDGRLSAQEVEALYVNL
ncbi:MAG: TetR/AcrR family transcriptional regulator, partial [Pseudomonadota bacterium]